MLVAKGRECIYVFMLIAISRQPSSEPSYHRGGDCWGGWPSPDSRSLKHEYSTISWEHVRRGSGQCLFSIIGAGMHGKSAPGVSSTQAED